MGKKNKSKSLCWTCSLPGHGLCSWDLDGVLEPNSYAIKHHSYLGDSYTILKCPKYTTEPIQCPLRNVKALCNAIITAACEDYRNAWHKRLEKETVEILSEIVLIEEFFASAWFKELSNLDPTALLDALQWDIFCEEIDPERAAEEKCKARKLAKKQRKELRERFKWERKHQNAPTSAASENQRKSD
jgi:hypothetical protein